MDKQGSLFNLGYGIYGETISYPEAPGFKATETSEQAANEIQSHAETLRSEVLKALEASPLTSDEISTQLGKSILAIRPRVSELSKMGKVADTGIRRKNASNKLAIVWKLA
jgi:predicted Rossmann fold nucleotide-binding protein DprA/Smf involved in DNA uptake